jgi:hypothetical protein
MFMCLRHQVSFEEKEVVCNVVRVFQVLVEEGGVV